MTRSSSYCESFEGMCPADRTIISMIVAEKMNKCLDLYAMAQQVLSTSGSVYKYQDI